ncbi:hypothetical protein EDC96DRAFT_453828, partial [Choanephora cucurbitarum]
TSAQDIWDIIKREAQTFTKAYQLETNKWQIKTLKKYQSKRNRILRDYKNTAILSSTLPQVERITDSLQQEVTLVSSLQAGKFWREKGERSAGLLKSLVDERMSQCHIPALFDPQRNETVSTTDDKIRVMTNYYENLYHPDTVDHHATDQLLTSLPGRSITPQQASILVEPYTMDDILEASHRSPWKSSPGSDGLPY